ncbi:hypothetical protein RRSWK_00513 [Rhodopirellula sp. SWK7]|nr:hypothetical protein RRSWK_00513 [Rhodopirellula sp. SWK7]
MRQGPHHGAQKSTNTGFDESSTSVWKVWSFTLTADISISVFVFK